jgi:hypothetical protein
LRGDRCDAVYYGFTDNEHRRWREHCNNPPLPMRKFVQQQPAAAAFADLFRMHVIERVYSKAEAERR